MFGPDYYTAGCPSCSATADGFDGFVVHLANHDELADVLEVLLALADDLGVDRDQLEKLRTTKALELGGFAGQIVWSGNA